MMKMNKKESIYKKSNLREIILVGAAALVGIGAINHGFSTEKIEEITSTYQGYTVDEGKSKLIFDENIQELRTGAPKLAIYGDYNNLEIGKEYLVKYSVPYWENVFPKKIKSISEN